MKNSFNAKFLAVLLLSTASTQLFAGLNTATLSVTATVGNNCTISTSAVAFGNYDPAGINSSSPLNGSGQVNITCTKGATPNITLDVGSNSSSGIRRMINGNGDYLTYELYKPSSNTVNAACSYTGAVVWGSSGTNIFTPTAAPNKNTRSFNVCGQIAAGQDVVNGSYTDTVTATVNF